MQAGGRRFEPCHVHQSFQSLARPLVSLPAFAAGGQHYGVFESPRNKGLLVCRKPAFISPRSNRCSGQSCSSGDFHFLLLQLEITDGWNIVVGQLADWDCPGPATTKLVMTKLTTAIPQEAESVAGSFMVTPLGRIALSIYFLSSFRGKRA